MIDMSEIRTRTPRSVRVSAALAGVAGMIVLAGCSSSAEAESPATDAATTAPSSSASAPATDSSTDASSTAYADGTYTASGTYQTPETVEEIEVTVTLEGDVITDVSVTGDPTARESEQYQSQFIGGIADEVVGENIDDISVSRVAGSSLTSGGFNDAIDAIKAEAAA